VSEPDAGRLRALVDDALVDLAGLRIDDPTAAPARHAIRLTSRTLRCFWLPAIDDLDNRQKYDDV